ncbi:hypothetical protein [Bradyrhizobium sp. F1.13.3]|uniref:hypothetical protein n=1 Tax=Bradyrhizobium sp. F1.13.3 TaxID=3156351 RepID=UPI00339B6110
MTLQSQDELIPALPPHRGPDMVPPITLTVVTEDRRSATDKIEIVGATKVTFQ